MNKCLRCDKNVAKMKRGYCRSCYETLRIKGLLTKIIKSPLPTSLTQYQQEILAGLMLGDGCLFRCDLANGQKSDAKLSVDRALVDKEYLIDNYNTFSEFCSSPPRYYTRHKLDKIYNGGAFATRQAQVFNNWHDEWYPNQKKIVPKNLVLTANTMAIWLCDDGSILPRHHNVARMQICFATHGFTKNDNEFLCHLLEQKLGETFNVYKEYNKYKIQASDNATRAFIQEIDKVFPDSMLRKAYWKNADARFYNDIPPKTGGEQYISYKLSSRDIIEINKLRYYKSITELAIMFNVSRTTIHRVISQVCIGFNSK